MSRYFVRNQQRALAEVVAQRKGHLLPPLLNELSLFTRAAPFGDTADMYYHSPSDKIGSNYAKATGMVRVATSRRVRGGELYVCYTGELLPPLGSALNSAGHLYTKREFGKRNNRLRFSATFVQGRREGSVCANHSVLFTGWLKIRG